ncbi:hypothetical protein ccbrp13_67880 [Ktedonobacteria bacterium brp13]|nr:hypothetical protein ccbrp13_67880 [Ktedonobacteria bacterium brp13]
MGTVLFVHGAGIRFPDDREMFEQIKIALAHYRPDLAVSFCTWGEHLGTRLHAGGAAIPHYTHKEDTTQTTADVALWSHLQQDPWYELRALVNKQQRQQILNLEPVSYHERLGSLRPFMKRPHVNKSMEEHWEIRDSRLRALEFPLTLQIKLTAANLDQAFATAKQMLFASSMYQDALRNVQMATDVEMLAPILARAVIALMQQNPSRNTENQLQENRRLRDDIIMLLTVEFARALHTDNVKSGGQWQQLRRSVFARSQQERQRRILLDMFTPFIGDVIFYQARGEQLRDLILAHIQHVTPPITLLGHSLGGVACVDILAQHQLPQVHSLITAGTQAPLLYEMDALQSLFYGQALPSHFPPWLNIYDMRDILSYVGEELFPDKIQDIRVNNRHAYPQAHNTYWTNPETWQAVLPLLPPV